MEPELPPLTSQDTFCFECTPQVPCFNECCRDLNQLLTPYDILRLKTHLGLTSDQFLARYTVHHSGPESGLPVVTLRPTDSRDLRCPFVTPKGCSVYEDRPSSCRMYPLVRAVSRSRATGEITERFMVLKEPHCLGFEKGTPRSAQQWIEDQKIAVYNENNDKLLRIISLKNKTKPGVLDPQSRHLFFTALYDLDTFRSRIINNKPPAGFPMDSEVIDKALEDDVALLDLGIQWIARVLFGQV